MSKGTKIVIGIFAVIMALSMMLPSLAPIFAGNTNADDQETEQQDTQQTEDTSESTEDMSEKTEDSSEKTEETDNKDEDAKEESTDDVTAGVPDNDTLKDLAEENADEVKKFQQRLEEDPNNLAALLNLGQTYMNWGYSAQYSSSTDEEKEYSNDLLNKSIEYFDRYLALADSDAVRVQKISAQYYLGNTQESLDAMKKITEEKPEYPLAWAHLGLFYEWQYDFTNAKAAYQKAEETDPNNEYGVKSFAEEHISSINSYSADFSKLTNEELLGTNAKPQEGLPGIIANNNDI